MARKSSNYQLFLLYSLIAIVLNGCALHDLPAPPRFLSTIELSGPYDKEMPEKYEGQLRGASLAADWAIPYIFMSVAMHYESLGDEVKTIHYFNRSIEEFRKRNDISGEGTATTRKIFALHEFGKIQEAFNLIREKDKIWTTAPMKAFVEHNYGHYYLMNGDYQKALSFLKLALDGNANHGDNFNLLLLKCTAEFEYGVSLLLADYVPYMSKKYRELEFDATMFASIRKNVDPAIAHLENVLALNREIRGTRVGRETPQEVYQTLEANAHNFLGLAKGIRGNREGALKSLALSEELSRKTGFRVGEMDSIFFLNQVYLLEKDISNGGKAAERMNEMADRYRLPFYQVWAKYLLSRYALGFGNTSRAISILKQAADIMEQQRTGLVIDQLKETYLFNRYMIHENLVYLLAREGDFKGALEVAERAKSRVLVDLLAEKDISRTRGEADLLSQQSKLNGEILHIRKELMKTNDEKRAVELVSSLDTREDGRRAVAIKIRVENEELSSLISVDSTDIAEIQTLLDGETTLIDYLVTDDILYVWSIDKKRIHLERVKISREALRNLVGDFLAAIVSRDKARTETLSQKLYETLLHPIAPFLTGTKVSVVPHDALYYLPFAALKNQGKYLAESFSLSYLPSVRVLKYVQEKKGSQGTKLLAFGNPDLGDKSLDLPYAGVEVEKIQKRAPGAMVFLREQATKARAKELLGSYDIVHFATHGLFVEDAPVNSSLLLAPTKQDDGRLTALEIFKLQFSGRAIVLSACQTALGKSSTGSELVGLNRSFLYAGSPSVVTTLWSIDDKATADFMDDFYRGYLSGTGIADSLRQAQIGMIQKGYEPLYWAPFILTGRN
jgi:CHAT domain-containing protein